MQNAKCNSLRCFSQGGIQTSSNIFNIISALQKTSNGAIQCIDCHPDVHITALSEKNEQRVSAACSTSATIPTGADNIGMIEYVFIYQRCLLLQH